MDIETAVERFEYVCGRCDARWHGDFDVRRATGATGEVTVLYSRLGLPCLAPHASHTLCPCCGRGPVNVKSLGIPDPEVAATGQAGIGRWALPELVRHALDHGDAEALAGFFGDAAWPLDGPALHIARDAVTLDMLGQHFELGRDARVLDVVHQGNRLIFCLNVTARPLDFPVYLTVAMRGVGIVAARVTADAVEALADIDAHWPSPP